jgi:hypothetical protein
MAQWIRRLPTEQEILGSSPSMGFFFLGGISDASVAERLRRWIQVPVNFVGVGSIPTGCTFFSFGFFSFCVEQKSCSNRGSNSGPRACEARVITNYTIRAYERKKSGGAGFRSLCLPIANRPLYRVSYTPRTQDNTLP